MLLMQMRKSLDHIQEILLRQFSSNVIGVCTIPTSANPTSTNILPIAPIPFDDFLLQNESNQFQLNPTAIYRSIPNEQQFFNTYLPYYLPYINDKYFKQRPQFPFFSSNFFDCNNNFNNFNLSNRLSRFYNNNNQTRAGTLITNENCKLININNFNWLDNFQLSNCSNTAYNQNGARQSNNASDYFLPYSHQINNLDVYLNKFRLDNDHNFNNHNKYLNTKFHLPNLPISSFKENEKLFKQTKSSPMHLLSDDSNFKESNCIGSYVGNSSRTNYTRTNDSDIRDIRGVRENRNSRPQFSLIEPYSNLLSSDDLDSRSAGSHCSSSCLPIYNSDLNSPNSFDLLPYPHNLYHQQHQNQLIQNLIRQNIQQNVQHHYLLSQIQNLQQQQHQFYNNVFTTVFYNDSDSNASDYKTDQCLTIHNLLCCFEVS